MPYTLSATPEDYKALIKRSLKLYRAAFMHVFLFALIASIIAFTPRLTSVILHKDLTALGSLNWRRVWFFLTSLATLVFITAILWRIQCFVAGKRDSILSDFLIAFKKLPSIFVASVIQIFSLKLIFGIGLLGYILVLAKTTSFPLSWDVRLIIFLISLLQLLAGFYIFYLFYFYLPLILIEGKGIISSLKTSCLLVWKHLWQTFSFQVTPWIAYVITIILIRNIFHIDLHLFFTTIENVTIYSTCLHILIFALFLPWISTNLLVQLHDLELRKAWQK